MIAFINDQVRGTFFIRLVYLGYARPQRPTRLFTNDNINMTDIANAQSRYPQVELANLPEDLRVKILEVQEKAGFVPNVFLA